MAANARREGMRSGDAEDERETCVVSARMGETVHGFLFCAHCADWHRAGEFGVGAACELPVRFCLRRSSEPGRAFRHVPEAHAMDKHFVLLSMANKQVCREAVQRKLAAGVARVCDEIDRALDYETGVAADVTPAELANRPKLPKSSPATSPAPAASKLPAPEPAGEEPAGEEPAREEPAGSPPSAELAEPSPPCGAT